MEMGLSDAESAREAVMFAGPQAIVSVNPRVKAQKCLIEQTLICVWLCVSAQVVPNRCGPGPKTEAFQSNRHSMLDT